MTPDPMPEPDGPEDERFVYVVTAAGVEALGRATPPASRRSKPPSPATRAGGDGGGVGARRGCDAGSG
jgi:hypothetical protein